MTRPTPTNNNNNNNNKVAPQPKSMMTKTLSPTGAKMNGNGNDNDNAPARSTVGSARGGRKQQQQPIQKPPARQFAVVRNVTLPEGLDAWARSPEGKASLADAAIGAGDVSFIAGMIKLHGDDIDEVDRAVRAPEIDLLARSPKAPLLSFAGLER